MLTYKLGNESLRENRLLGCNYLNNGLCVQYSSHDLNTGQKVCYSSHGLKIVPFSKRTVFKHLNIVLVNYSGPHCIWENKLTSKQFLVHKKCKYNDNCILLVPSREGWGGGGGGGVGVQLWRRFRIAPFHFKKKKQFLDFKLLGLQGSIKSCCCI